MGDYSNYIMITMSFPCSKNLHGLKPTFFDWHSRIYTISLKPFLRTLLYKPCISSSLVYTPPTSHALQSPTSTSFLKLPWLQENVLPLSAHQKSHPSQSFVHSVLFIYKAFFGHQGQQGFCLFLSDCP